MTVSEKIVSLTKYVDDMKSKLSGPVPEKHRSDNGTAYRAFLEREIKMHSKKIEDLRFKVGGAK